MPTPRKTVGIRDVTQTFRAVYTDDQWEFISACSRAQGTLGRTLTLAEAFKVANRLGYRLVAPERPLPRFGRRSGERA